MVIAFESHVKGPWFETHDFCLGEKERNVRSESFSVCHAEELAKQTDKKCHTSSAYKQHMVLSISFVFSCTYYILYHFLRCFFKIYTQINSVISQPNVHVKNILVGTSKVELHLKCFELVKRHISKAAAYYFKFKEFCIISISLIYDSNNLKSRNAFEC